MENWKFVDGSQKRYMVSDHGRVRSLTRTIIDVNGNKNTTIGRILLTWETPDGYLTVRIQKGRSVRVSRLVAFHFLDGYDENKEVNHKDSNKSNNHYENLEWVTKRENIVHFQKSIGENKLPGVCLVKRPLKKPWTAKVKVNGKLIWLGYYKTSQEAHKVYLNYLHENSIINKYADGI